MFKQKYIYPTLFEVETYPGGCLILAVSKMLFKRRPKDFKNIYTPGVLDLKEVWGYANVRTDRGIENGCVEYSVMEWRVVS